MWLILILTAVVLVVGVCLIGFAVKAAKKDSVWEQVDENAPSPSKLETKREAWIGETTASEELQARGAAAGGKNGAPAGG